MTASLPPLPALPINPMTARTLDQAAVDGMLQAIYERFPLIFTTCAASERLSDRVARDGRMVDGFPHALWPAFRQFASDEFNLETLQEVGSLFLELRLRTRRMFDMLR